MAKWVINKSNVRILSLALSDELRRGRFTRVSRKFYERLNANVRAKIVEEIKRLPSVGKTIMGLALALLIAIPAYAGDLKASWYSVESLKKEGTWKTSKGVMANGKRFNENALTCATCDYPLGTMLLISSMGKSVQVEVTDRTNKRFKGKRIDLSKSAFSKIADLKQGIVPIKVEEVRRCRISRNVRIVKAGKF